MDCKKDKNNHKCNCTYEVCSRKGLCCECIRYHQSRRELPACYFSADVELTYDRSISRFITQEGNK
ncbi:MAG: DUF6485 family protein [Acidobacteriota bacterium]